MSAVVPARMEQKLMKKLDDLVKSGRYVSRSEAVRDAVRQLVAKYETPSLSVVYEAYARVAASFLAHLFGDKISDVILYGSVANGTATEESDIDLLILAKEEEPFKLTAEIVSLLYPLELQLNTMFSVNVYRQKDYIDALEKGFLFEKNVLETGKPLYGDLVHELRTGKTP